MSLSNEIVLRPRFVIELKLKQQEALSLFDNAKKETSQFVIHRVDDHVFLKIPRAEQHFWSPQLHLEIREESSGKVKLHGLYGPNPTVWTLFMFIHFVAAALFIGIGIWAYSNASLGNPYRLQIVSLFLVIAFWFALYFGGRMGKSTGRKEMLALDAFMRKTLLL